MKIEVTESELKTIISALEERYLLSCRRLAEKLRGLPR